MASAALAGADVVRSPSRPPPPCWCCRDRSAAAAGGHEPAPVHLSSEGPDPAPSTTSPSSTTLGPVTTTSTVDEPVTTTSTASEPVTTTALGQLPPTTRPPDPTAPLALGRPGRPPAHRGRSGSTCRWSKGSRLRSSGRGPVMTRAPRAARPSGQRGHRRTPHVRPGLVRRSRCAPIRRSDRAGHRGGRGGLRGGRHPDRGTESTSASVSTRALMIGSPSWPSIPSTMPRSGSW